MSLMHHMCRRGREDAASVGDKIKKKAVDGRGSLVGLRESKKPRATERRGLPERIRGLGQEFGLASREELILDHDHVSSESGHFAVGG